MEVIGFEGSWSEETWATYGAAAIRDGDTVINAVSKLYMPANKLIADVGSLTLIPPFPITTMKQYVVAILSQYNFIFRGCGLGGYSSESENAIYYFVDKTTENDDEMSLDRLARHICDQAISELSFSGIPYPAQDPKKVISTALTFAHKNPYLYALRTHLCGGKISTAKVILGKDFSTYEKYLEFIKSNSKFEWYEEYKNQF